MHESQGRSKPGRLPRQPYEAPAVRKIQIVPEELAVTGCKTRPFRTGPTTGCMRSNCMRIGS